MTRSKKCWLKRLLALDLVLLAVLVIWVLAQAVPSAEAVRLRNALLYDGVITPSELNWSPSETPADFRVEKHQAPPAFIDVTKRPEIASQTDNWSKSLALARTLQARLGDGEAITAGLEETLERITKRGEGYCGDFADVFSALANAAEIPNRRWSFSFDGYGGRGHIFNEVWDQNSKEWRAIDVFNNYIFVDAESNQPLSALKFLAALRGEGVPARIVQLNPSARPGFIIPEKATDYYRRGSSEWYIYWGSDITTLDEHPLVRIADYVSTHLSQLVSIAVGVRAPLRILLTTESLDRIEKLQRLRMTLLVSAIMAILMFLAAIGLWIAIRLQRKSEIYPDDSMSRASEKRAFPHENDPSSSR